MTLLDIRIKPRGGAATAEVSARPQPTWRPSDVADVGKEVSDESGQLPKKKAKPFRIGQHYTAVTSAMKRKTKSRFALLPLAGRSASMPAFDNPAIVESRTMYPSTVRDVGADHVLKSAFNQAKIGGEVLKGKWKGMPIYSLTLEERATCPTDCLLWRGCYGNGVHLAKRYRHGPDLEAALRREVAALSTRHRGGFAVRLHTLGDFYSVEYVALWAEMLAQHSELRVFGFSARWGADPISQALLKLAYENWDRFAMRFSNAPIETCSTITIDHPGQKPPDAVICPAQTGRTESCSTCSYCWATDKRVAFIRH